MATNFWRSAGDAEAGLVSAYDYMQNSMTQNFVTVPLVLSDDSRANSGGNFTRHEAFTATPVHGNVLDHWREVYFAVHAANDVLDNVPRITDPALNKDRVLGEAYFIRGWAFFQLTRLCGRIPLPLQPSKSADQDFNLKRSNVTEVYAQIVKDLLEAERLLPATHPNNNRARPAKGSARAWLAKVCLQQPQPNYALTLAKYEEIMGDAQYRLVAGNAFGTLFAVGAQNTSETIFEMSFRPSRATEGQDMDAETVQYTGSAFRLRPHPKIITAFAASTGDLRAPVSPGTFNNNAYIRKYETAAPGLAAGACRPTTSFICGWPTLSHCGPSA